MRLFRSKARPVSHETPLDHSVELLSFVRRQSHSICMDAWGLCLKKISDLSQIEEMTGQPFHTFDAIKSLRREAENQMGLGNRDMSLAYSMAAYVVELADLLIVRGELGPENSSLRKNRGRS